MLGSVLWHSAQPPSIDGPTASSPDTRSNKEDRKFSLTFSIILFFAGLASRLPFRSRTLYYWDAVQFALPMHDFDISKGQPNPPGYILFVGLARLVNKVVHNDNLSLTILAALFSAFSAVLIFLLALKLWGERRSAVMASCLWLTSPILWFYGEIGEIYSAGAFTSVAVAFYTFSFWKYPTERSAILSAGAFAACGGIRPDHVAFLAPLWLFPFWRSRSCRRFWAVSMVVFGLVYLSWYIPLIELSGGYSSYSKLLRGAFIRSVGFTSIFFGASIPEHLWMLGRLASGLVLGLLPFLFLMPVLWVWARNQRGLLVAPGDLLFLIVWATPFLIFYALIHLGKLGYCLTCLPPLVLLAARWTMLRIPTPPKGARSFAALLVLSVVANACFFFLVPRFGEHPETRVRFKVWRLLPQVLNRSILYPVYDEIHHTARVRKIYFAAINKTLSEKPTTLIFISSGETGYLDWRVLMYYFPHVPVYEIKGLLEGALHKRVPVLALVGFWWDHARVPLDYRPGATAETASLNVANRGRALVIVSSVVRGLELAAEPPSSLQDITPRANDRRLLVYRLLLFEANGGKSLEIRSGPRLVMIRP